MSLVKKSSPVEIKSLATGVCSIGKKEGGFACCTGFRVSKDLIITNFHCIRCVHDKAKGMGGTINLGRPMMALANLLLGQPLPSDTVSAGAAQGKKAAQGQSVEKKDELTNDIPTLNKNTEGFNKINFKTYAKYNKDLRKFEPRTDKDLKNSALNIQKIVYGSKELDLLIIKVKDIPDSQKILKLSRESVTKYDPLTVIGHPGKSDYPSMKMYDESSSCAVYKENVENSSRIHVFGHQCDTLPGNSGSPIFNASTGEVVGLHWGGGAKTTENENYKRTYNKAVKMEAILDRLDNETANYNEYRDIL